MELNLSDKISNIILLNDDKPINTLVKFLDVMPKNISPNENLEDFDNMVMIYIKKLMTLPCYKNNVKSIDVLYVLFYTMIMAKSDLPDSPMDMFLRLLKNTKQNSDFDEDFLKDIYNDIFTTFGYNNII